MAADRQVPALHAAGNASRRLLELDGIRGIAILLVLLSHYVAQQVRPAPETAFSYIVAALNFGWVGVDLFFVLSGFLIGGILMDNRNSPRLCQTFYIRRVCRIFPVYYAWLGLTFLLLSVALPSYLKTLLQPDFSFWTYASYTQNLLLPWLGGFGNEWYGVTWSLALEEQFYLLFPWFVRFCPPRRLSFTLVMLCLSATVFRGLAFWLLPGNGLAGYVLLPCRWDSLFAGALAAWMVRQPGVPERIRQKEGMFFWGGALILSVIGGLLFARQGDLRDPGMQFIGYPLLAVFFSGLLLLSLHSSKEWIRAIFRNSLLRGLGVVSYFVYLIHQPMSYFLHRLLWRQEYPQIVDLPTAITTFAAFCATLALAVVSWKYFESRLVSWGRARTY